jgi:hypothetical protein
MTLSESGLNFISMIERNPTPLIREIIERLNKMAFVSGPRPSSSPPEQTPLRGFPSILVAGVRVGGESFPNLTELSFVIRLLANEAERR